MTTGLKAIETSYHGYRFRSRTEARWAVFMDAAGVSWEYEQEGYDLDGIWYLPDFVIHRGAYWMEVKPQAPVAGDAAWIKAARLSAAGDRPRPVLLAIGQPDVTTKLSGFIRGRIYAGYRWTRCLRCNLVAPALNGDGANLPCDCFRKGVDSYPAWNDPVLLEAFEGARAERFGT